MTHSGEAQQNNNWEERNKRDLRDTQEKFGLIPCEVGCGPGTDTYEKQKQIERDIERRNSRDTGGCVVGNGMGGCDIGPLRKRDNKPKGNFNFNFHIGN